MAGYDEGQAMTSNVELLPLPEILRDIAAGRRNSVGDYWNRDYCDQAATKIEALQMEAEALRAEAERLQDIVRPRREDACLTIDHWRMRAYDLEANWSRCSRACADEQDKRVEAEARAERLAEALQKLLTGVEDLTAYMGEDDEIGQRPCCGVLSYNPHADYCAVTIAHAALHPTAAQEDT